MPGHALPSEKPVDVVLSPVDIDVKGLVDAAVAAEEAGFDTVWTYDHLSGAVLNGASSLEVWGALAAIASATERVSIGPLVINAALRHPAHVATAAATLQDLSGGRLRLGLGAGAGPQSPYSREASMLGLPVEGAASRREKVADVICYLRELWSGADAYAGATVGFVGVAGVALPRPVPQLVVGANGPKMAALAGRLADGINLHSWESDLPGLISVARKAARLAGREPPEVSVEGPFENDWLDAPSGLRQRLRDLGVHRVMVRWNAGLGVGTIEQAGRSLRKG